MSPIRLLYVENIITRKTGAAQQRLVFFMSVENLAYEKTVEVLWAGEDNIWHALPAAYHSRAGHNLEHWRAEASIAPSTERSLPGNIQFALRLKAQDEEYWDNHHGENHFSEADSGIRLAPAVSVLNLQHEETLQDGQRLLPVTVAVDSRLDVDKVTVHWSTDNWKTVYHTACHARRNYWDKTWASNARNPNQYGDQVWEGALKLYNAYRVEYSITCEYHGKVLWDNNAGANYVAQRKPLRLLILNLHCYQEEDQDAKFSRIAQAIDELGVDIVCLQEVAELWNDGNGDWASNSARIINERLAAPYHLLTDWGHLGFDQYREGVAILSRYPVVRHKSKYVSSSHDPYNIHTRKVLMAQLRVPYFGLLNVFSSHLSWWEDGFAEQFENLRKWASDEQTALVRGTLLCGDFNIKAGSRGYRLVVGSREYEDQYLAATDKPTFDRIFREKRPDWHLLDHDGRIDYVFLHVGSALRATGAQEIFTEQRYGRVSDHTGYLVTFEPK